MTKYKIVPADPTEDMLRAAQDAWLSDPAWKTSTLYKATVQAAPDATEDAEPVERVVRFLQERFGPQYPVYAYQACAKDLLKHIEGRE